MPKKLVITDVTRLDKGNCCVAGVCPEEGFALYRLSNPKLTQGLVRQYSIWTGSVVTGSFCKMNSTIPPHTEDCSWGGWMSLCGTCDDSEIRKIFENSCYPDINSALGVTSKETEANGFIGVGRSIATVKPNVVKLWYGFDDKAGRKKVKMLIRIDEWESKWLTVNDYRFYNADESASVIESAIDHVNARLLEWKKGFLELYVRVGLTRPYEGKFWLQIDGLHFFRRDDGMYFSQFGAPLGNESADTSSVTE